MDHKRYEITLDVLGEMIENLGNLPEETQAAVEAQTLITIASLYVAEYAKWMMDGKEPYDALLSAVRGEMEVPVEKASLITLLAAKAKDFKPKPGPV